MLSAASVIFAAAVAGLWLYKDVLCLDGSDLCILTGAAAFLFTLGLADIFRKRDIFEEEKELQSRQEEIGNEDFSDSGIFFRK